MKIVHRYFDDINGIRMHFAEAGQGAPLILCHGFPELWYTWRHQIPVLAAAGYRVIAVDMRGAGETTVTMDVADYSAQNLCADILALMDRLGLAKATIIGHDWGSVLAWNMALHHPERVTAVAGINATGLAQLQTPKNLLSLLEAKPGISDYHFYFQEVGVAEAELEADVERFHILIRRGCGPEDGFDILRDFHSVRARGGLLKGYPERPSRSVLMTAADLSYYVANYRRTGFRGMLNYYRCYDQLAEWAREIVGTQLDMLALVITCGQDPVMTPGLTDNMELIAKNLTRHHIEACSHWSTEERPEEVNEGLLSWLGKINREPERARPDAGMTVA